jgi:hypothetical protein
MGPLNMFHGVDIYALAVDPTTPATLYAGTEVATVFKSTDAGGTWVRKHGSDSR